MDWLKQVRRGRVLEQGELILLVERKSNTFDELSNFYIFLVASFKLEGVLLLQSSQRMTPRIFEAQDGRGLLQSSLESDATFEKDERSQRREAPHLE